MRSVKNRKIYIIHERCDIIEGHGKASGLLYGIFSNIHFYLFIYLNYKYWPQGNKDIPPPFLKFIQRDVIKEKSVEMQPRAFFPIASS